MIITRTEPELLTIDLLNALLANFATGVITLDELWEQIDSAEDVAYFRRNMLEPLSLPVSIRNRMLGPNEPSGI